MGLDAIPNIVLKTCAISLTPGLPKTFSKSIDCGALPIDWRNAMLAPHSRKVTDTLQNIIGQFYKHQFTVNFLNTLFADIC